MTNTTKRNLAWLVKNDPRLALAAVADLLSPTQYTRCRNAVGKSSPIPQPTN